MAIENNSPCFVNDLMGLTFKIPAYQRGYRWREKEVKTLLEDITDFIEEKADEVDKYYSLQPLVVKKNEKEVWNVIDGQQRLTTLFLIIKYLDDDDTDLFKIEYETREESFEFLQNIKEKSQQDEDLNIDFYHFKEAYKSIKNFFEGKLDEQKKEFSTTLLDKCKVLWHESQDEEIEVFVRLNSGKIPLLEAENIKALFLAKREGVEEKEIEKRAKKWYEAEKKARDNNDFIYCVLEHVSKEHIMEEMPVLSDDIQRIEVYLKAIVPYENKEGYLFNHFYKKYKDKSIGEEWDKLIKAIQTLSGHASGKGSEELDREIFHYLGFLTLHVNRIDQIYEKWLEVKDKSKFAACLFELVNKNVEKYIQRIDELTYNEDKEALQAILLLFNLEYLNQNESLKSYFEFNRFVLEQWSLEHIYAQNSEGVVSAKELEALQKLENLEKKRSLSQPDSNKMKIFVKKIREWLEEVQKHLEDEKLNKDIKSALGFSKNFFKNLVRVGLLKAMDENFKENDFLHRLQNLTLLDKRSNSAIGNLIFSEKQQKIKELDDQKRLIPICTREVFRKVFSENENKNSPIFTKEDQEEYLKAIKKYLKKYGITSQKG
ncbi:DUF262 domain-containing protein [Helicobacter suis]|uniref:DUF262 domain-containing protein n=1 Tax=Helicobacter suis TaxID=104628 RepID=UPI000CEEEB8F|nr:DUF262 domain-containing protein [Helicobacter suis]